MRGGALLELLGVFHGEVPWLEDPNVLFVLVALGVVGVLAEVAAPGFGGPGIIGSLLLLAAVAGVLQIPVEPLAVILLVLATAAFVQELFARRPGIAAAAGTVLFALGGLWLFAGPDRADATLVVPIAAATGAASLLLGRFARNVRAQRGHSGGDVLIGRTTTVRAVTEGRLQGLVDGTWWNLRSSGSIAVGDTVRVVRVEDLHLIVEPADDIAGTEGTEHP